MLLICSNGWRIDKLNPERVSNVKPFINKCTWKGINYPSEIDDRKTFEKNNLTTVVNILYLKEKEICPSYNSPNDYKWRKRGLALSCG